MESPIKNIRVNNIIRFLLHLFDLFGNPGFIDSDRGSQLKSQEFNVFCSERGNDKSRTLPYYPQGSGQTEHYNGVN